MKISFPEFQQIYLIEEKIKLFKTYEYPLNGSEVIKRLRLKNNKDKSFYIKEAKNIWLDNPLLEKMDYY